jgi:hypothetical protein
MPEAKAKPKAPAKKTAPVKAKEEEVLKAPPSLVELNAAAIEAYKAQKPGLKGKK